MSNASYISICVLIIVVLITLLWSINGMFEEQNKMLEKMNGSLEEKLSIEDCGICCDKCEDTVMRTMRWFCDGDLSVSSYLQRCDDFKRFMREIDE